MLAVLNLIDVVMIANLLTMVQIGGIDKCLEQMDG
ncbi:YqhA family protein [Neisseria gonorrhoeae]|nr:YqhA family protein [Neisseria gonorrhoeae]